MSRDPIRERIDELDAAEYHMVWLDNGELVGDTAAYDALRAVLDVCSWGDFADGRQTEHIRAAVARALGLEAS